MPTAVAAASPTVVTDTAAAPMLIVDDSEVPCRKPRDVTESTARTGTIYTTIAAAVAAGQPGDEIRVCPGIYAERVVVTKPLTLRGDTETVEAVDCFSPTLPPFNPDSQAIVMAPSDQPAAALFDLQADDIELRGFVLQGTGRSAAVMTSSEHSGYEIDHNLMVGHSVAAYFRSSDPDENVGERPSNFHDNCLRGNGWGVANWFLPLIDARIHHNSTFDTGSFTYEQTRNCPEFLVDGNLLRCSGSPIGMTRVTFDHNVSREDDQVFRLAFSTSTILFENIVTSARVGARLTGANTSLEIVGNELEVRLGGVVQQSTPALPSPTNTSVLIRGNTITGAGTSAGIGMGLGALKQSWILENVVRGVDGEGIALTIGNTGNLVRGNVVENSGSNGIRAGAGATGNTFEFNEMHGNGRILSTGGVDARDDVPGSNTWRGNECDTDIPVGTICGVQ